LFNFYFLISLYQLQNFVNCHACFTEYFWRLAFLKLKLPNWVVTSIFCVHMKWPICICTSYIPERHKTLGPDLATAYFAVARNGAVKFEGSSRWISRKSANDKYQQLLPTMPNMDTRLEAVDMSDTDLMYISLDNFGMQFEHALQWKLASELC